MAGERIEYTIGLVTTDIANTSTLPNPGLCQSCRHARRIESDRGSIFLMCKLSFEDSRFVKYPRLPELVCRGYRPERENPPAAGAQSPPAPLSHSLPTTPLLYPPPHFPCPDL